MPRKRIVRTVALEQPFDDLCRELGNARAALRAVLAAAAGDENVAAAVNALIGLVEDAVRSAERARKAVRPPVNIDGIRRALPACQRQLSRLMQAFRAGLGSPETMEEFRRGARHDLAWVVGRSAAPLFAADWALGTCWRAAGAYAALNPGGGLPSFVPRP